MRQPTLIDAVAAVLAALCILAAVLSGLALGGVLIMILWNNGISPFGIRHVGFTQSFFLAGIVVALRRLVMLPNVVVETETGEVQ